MISAVSLIRFARGEFWKIEHTEDSLICIGIANLECAVLPPGSKVAAIPLEATVKTIPPVDLIVEASALQRKVLPVPPKPYTKKKPPFFRSTADRTAEKAFN